MCFVEEDWSICVSDLAFVFLQEINIYWGMVVGLDMD